MPQVSVILPAYNCETTLERCLDSVLSQTFRDFELIIVNDGSTDGTLSIAESFARDDERVTVISQANQGQGMARNAAIKLSKGSYIAFIDSDDRYKPGALASMVDALESNDADISNCEIENLLYKGDEPLKRLSFYRIPDSYAVVSGKQAASLCMDCVVPILFNSPCCKLIKKSLFVDNDIWFPGGHRYSEDLPTCLKLFLVSERVALIHEALYEYIREEDSTTTSKPSIKKAVDIVRNVNDVLDFIAARDIEISVANFVLSMIFPIEKNLVLAPRPADSAQKEAAMQVDETVRAWRRQYEPDLKVADLSTVQKIKLRVSHAGLSKAFAVALSVFRWIPQVRYLT